MGASSGSDVTETRPVDEPAAAVPSTANRLERGAQVGRYVVVDRVGAGGMGEVYLGFDPALDRRVAIKLLRPAVGESTGASDGRARLLREGQAMAKLSHPNVLTVYDVGTLGDDVFIALEFIQGGTVKEWLRTRRRPWREVLDVFVRAGRGLAAAHVADIVHRDFKPGNVLVGDGTQVRVMDFGLARTASAELEESQPQGRAAALEVTPGGGLLATDLTIPGTAMGTPAYMSPEQHRGESADARSDQFSYCVALYEGLYGERPFGGETQDELKRAVLDGKVRDAPADTRVPARIRRALLRGLSVDPGRRFESMDVLLAELDRDPRRRRMRGLALAGAAGVALASYLGFEAGRQGSGDVCGGTEERLAGVWDDARKQAIEERFTATGLTYAADTFGRVARMLDEYVAAWTAAHHETCTATHVRNEQSVEVFDLKMACLADRFDQLDALLQTYAAADPAVVENAVSLAHGLAAVDDCADPELVRRRIRLPRDPLVRARVAELERELERARALLNARDGERAKTLATDTLEQIRAVGFLPLEAEALSLLADVEARVGSWKDAENAYHEAVQAAEAAGHEQLKAHLWIKLGSSLGRRGKFDDGERFLGLAEAALRRAGGDPVMQSTLLKERGVIHSGRGEYEQAFELTKRAVDLYRDTANPDDIRVAHLYNNLGVIRSQQGRRKDALRYLKESVERKRTLLGPDHPMVGAALVNLGAIAMDAEEPGVGRESLLEARRIYDATLPPEHGNVGTLLVNTAALAESEERYEDARRDLVRAEEILTKALPEQHPTVAHVRYALGVVELRLGHHQAAMAMLERSLALRETLYGPDDVAVSIALAPLAQAAHAIGETERARELVGRARTIVERPIEDAFSAADASFQLAKALWDLDVDREHAIVLAKRARAQFDALGDTPPRMRAELAAWLAERSP